MLHMFKVDVGTMVYFDINLSMELVSVLQEQIAKEHNVPVDMQVLLVSGGIMLPPDQRVCLFCAGTDTNPIFLYNKQFYAQNVEILPELLVVDTGPEQPSLEKELDDCLKLPDTIQTVVERSQLAQRFYESAEATARVCQRIVDEQHLQHQGFAAAIANMDDTIPSVRSNTEQFIIYFQQFLDEKDHYYQLAQTVSEVSSTLASIPLLPPLVDLVTSDPMVSITSSQALATRRDSVTLLDWLHLRNSNDSFQKLSQMCSRGIEQHTEDVVNRLHSMLGIANELSQHDHLRNIGGLSERLSGLEELKRQLRILVQEQRDSSQAIQQNYNRASLLGDTSVLPDLCQSHCEQLSKMLRSHKKILDILRRIKDSKKELNQNIFMRMRWVYRVATAITQVYEHTHMYTSSLKTLKEQLTILQQTHNIPHLYLTAVAEVVRRRTFSQAFLMWANDLACQMCEVHTEEVARRQSFQSQFDGHMLNCLFPGLEDSPPPFATQAPEVFDNKLPQLTLEDLKALKDKCSAFSLSVSMPDLNTITQFFESKSIINPIKPKEVQRLVEEMVAMEQPSDSQTAGACFLASVLPFTDRGFESETDTEEFEKVGQSPTEITFQKRAESMRQEKANQLSKSKEEMEKSMVNIRQDLGSLRNWLNEEHSHIHNFLEQLSLAYRDDVDHKTGLIYDLKQELSAKDAEIGELRLLTEELQKRLSLSLEAELRERELRERAEAEREQSIKEATEHLVQAHRREMETARSRFVASIPMERSPSELSLDQMDLGIQDFEGVVKAIIAEWVQQCELVGEDERLKCKLDYSEVIDKLKKQPHGNKQIFFNDVRPRVMVDKDSELEIENLRMRNLHLETECRKHQDTIYRLTGSSLGSIGSESSLLERVEPLEASKVKKHEAELVEACCGSVRQTPTPSTTFQDLSTSITLCDSEGSQRDAAISPDNKPKTHLRDRLSRSTKSLIQEGKVSVTSLNVGDTVVVLWDERYLTHAVLQECSTLYFVHTDSLKAWSHCLPTDESHYMMAKVIGKEYCIAKKDNNRYNVSKGAKFYRVKVIPFGLPHNWQSSSGCSS